MNILVVSHEYPPLGGGGANACFFLTKEYARKGHKVTVITSKYKNLPGQEESRGVRIIRVKALRKNKEKSTFFEMLTYLFSALMKAKKIAKAEQIDVCQVFFGIPSGPIGLMLKRKYGIPYVVRFGGGDIPGAQKRFSVIYKLLAPIIRSIWRNAEYLVANSEDLKERALSFEKQHPIEIIENGVDNEFFIRTRVKEHPECNILFVSRLIEGKGLQYIIPHMREIEQKTTQPVHLTIVGDGPYRDELEKITEESGVSELVSFIGHKNKTELLPYYNDADVFILPSLSEGMPNVVLEAMAMELPIVMTPCGGSKELIRGNGYVVPVHQFTEKLIELCDHEEWRKEMGRLGGVRARTDFSWESKADAYMKLFEKAVWNKQNVGE